MEILQYQGKPKSIKNKTLKCSMIIRKFFINIIFKTRSLVTVDYNFKWQKYKGVVLLTLLPFFFLKSRILCSIVK